MDPTVISSTAQQYRGIRYYLCGKYFQREGIRLHRVVWQDNHPELVLPPKAEGWDVHHVDHNRSNNAASNLELLSRADHRAHHGSTLTEQQIEKLRAGIGVVIEGNARLTSMQRSLASERGWATVTYHEVKCEVCGSSINTPFPSRTRFCGGTCKARARRARLRGQAG